MAFASSLYLQYELLHTEMRQTLYWVMSWHSTPWVLFRVYIKDEVYMVWLLEGNHPISTAHFASIMKGDLKQIQDEFAGLRRIYITLFREFKPIGTYHVWLYIPLMVDWPLSMTFSWIGMIVNLSRLFRRDSNQAHSTHVILATNSPPALLYTRYM